jgi:hypothetical protein
MSSFTKPFKVIVHNVPLKEKPFEISGSFNYYSEVVKGLVINIPDGYRTNFASVPSIFYPFIPPVGRYSKATVVHDWLIEHKKGLGISYSDINKIFEEAMEILNVSKLKRKIMYWGVQYYWKFGRHISTPIRKLLGKELI